MPTTLPDVVVATAPGRPVAIVLPAVAAGGTLAGNGQPAGGIVAVDPAGQGLTYTPWDGFLGVDAFAYAVSLAGTGAPAEGRVLVTVAVPNAAPIANDDAASTRPGAAVLVPVLANDSDPDGDPLSLAAVVMSGHGTVAVDADQRRLRYVPQTGFVGRDSFAYTISDGRGGAATATVSVAVEAADRAPVVRNDAAEAVAGAPVTVPVLANDNDPDGDRLGLVALGLPRRGALAVNPDQSVTYTPAAGFAGIDEFTYTTGDGWGGTATARVEVTVEPPPARPTYPNGYLYRRRLVVPAAAAAEGEHQGFPLWVRLQGDWLKPAAPAPGGPGRMETAGGLDLRFEAEDGARLPHDVAERIRGSRSDP